jgi:hypothetical protein
MDIAHGYIIWISNGYHRILWDIFDGYHLWMSYQFFLPNYQKIALHILYIIAYPFISNTYLMGRTPRCCICSASRARPNRSRRRQAGPTGSTSQLAMPLQQGPYAPPAQFATPNTATVEALHEPCNAVGAAAAAQMMATHGLITINQTFIALSLISPTQPLSAGHQSHQATPSPCPCSVCSFVPASTSRPTLRSSQASATFRDSN